MKKILFAITFFCISAASFGQSLDTMKIVKYTSYGSSYPRWEVRDVLLIPSFNDTPTIAANNKLHWTGGLMLRLADSSIYVHNGRRWNKSVGGGGVVSTFNSRTGAITPLFADYASFYSALGHTHSTIEVTSGQFGTGRLGSGIASGTTYLRGDGVWSIITGGLDSVWIKQRISDSLRNIAIHIGYGLKDSGTPTNPVIVDTTKISPKLIEYKEEFTSLTVTTKTLAFAPKYPAATLLYYDKAGDEVTGYGLQSSTWYTIVGTLLTLNFTPASGDKFIIKYTYQP